MRDVPEANRAGSDVTQQQKSAVGSSKTQVVLRQAIIKGSCSRSGANELQSSIIFGTFSGKRPLALA